MGCKKGTPDGSGVPVVFRSPSHCHFGAFCGFGVSDDDRVAVEAAECEFCRDKEFLARYAAFFDRIADGFFVAVALCGIDQTVSCVDCIDNAFFAKRKVIDLERTEACHRHDHAVVESNCFHIFSTIFIIYVIASVDPICELYVDALEFCGRGELQALLRAPFPVADVDGLCFDDVSVSIKQIDLDREFFKIHGRGICG